MPRVGLVLGGGGIVGMAYHGAVLSGIADATGWDPRDAELVVGTSAGAASGAELRAGLSGHDLANRRADEPFTPEGERLLRSLGPMPAIPPTHVEPDVERARRAYLRLVAKATMLPGSVRPGVLISIAMSPGTLSTDWLAEQTRWLHGGRAGPGDRLWSCAIDLDTGRRVVFGRADAPAADVGDAVAASCAIPGVSAPVEIGGRAYVDGGGYSPTNADLLAGERLDLVVVSSPMSLHPRAATDRRDWMMRMACRRLLTDEVTRVRAHGTPVLVFEPDARDLRTVGRLLGHAVLDERRCRAVVKQVRRSTAERIEREALARHFAARRRARPALRAA